MVGFTVLGSGEAHDRGELAGDGVTEVGGIARRSRLTVELMTAHRWRREEEMRLVSETLDVIHGGAAEQQVRSGGRSRRSRFTGEGGENDVAVAKP